MNKDLMDVIKSQSENNDKGGCFSLDMKYSLPVVNS